MKGYAIAVFLVGISLTALWGLRLGEAQAQPKDDDSLEVILYFVAPEKAPLRGRLLFFDEDKEIYIVDTADGRKEISWRDTREVQPVRSEENETVDGTGDTLIATLRFRDETKPPIVGRLLRFDEARDEFLVEEPDGTVQRVSWSDTARIAPLSGTRGLGTAAARVSPQERGETFTVTTLNDSGPGSLRQAITAANDTPGPNTIRFDVRGTIAPASPLPALDDMTGGTIISGRGSVTLDGSGLSDVGNGLVVVSADNVIEGLSVVHFPEHGIEITGPKAVNNIIRACDIGTDGISSLGNKGNGIRISRGASRNTIGGIAESDRNIISGNNGGVYIVDEGTHANVILGNYIGTDVTGTKDLGNSVGISIIDGAGENTVGGRVEGARNVVSGNGDTGILIAASSRNVILGNYIGTDATGSGPLMNGIGMAIVQQSSHNIVGAADPGAGNIISGNRLPGIFIANTFTTNNIIQGNKIGTDRTGLHFLPNGNSGGIEIIEGASQNTIGGSGEGAGNIICGNKGPGVRFRGADSLGNRIERNSIFGNMMDGIVQAPTLLAVPSISALQPLTGTAEPDSTVEIFVDDTNQGKTYLASASADSNGRFSSDVDLRPYVGQVITVTATRGDGTTSEFSLPFAINFSFAADLVLPEGFHAGRFYAGIPQADGIAVRNDGSLLVGSELEPRGIFVARKGDTLDPGDAFSTIGHPFQSIDDLLLLEDGTLVVADNRAHMVFRIGPEGGAPEEFVSPAQTIPSFHPFGLATAPSNFEGPNVSPGDIIIADRSGSGGMDVPALWSVHPVTGLARAIAQGDIFSGAPWRIDFTADGLLLLYVERESGPCTIVSVDTEGNVAPFFSHDPKDRGRIAVHPATDEIFISLQDEARQIWWLPKKGAEPGVFASGFSGLMQGIEFSPDGQTLYVSTPYEILEITGPFDSMPELPAPSP